MDATRKIFLAALKSALLGEPAKMEQELNLQQWQELLDLAQMHQVLPLVYEALHPYIKKETIPDAAMLRQRVLRQVMVQTMKTSDFLALNQKLQAAGVKPLVVKGIICRNLYPKPDCRASGDEDILIPAEQLAQAHRVLAEFGMHTTLDREQAAKAYEIPYRKAESPLYIELHKHLFPPQSEAYGDLNRYFEGVHKRATAEEIQGATVYTLGCTDHLFYLICHAFKHFLHSGFGIRQVCDIILYANRYGEQIDWMRVLKNCKEIRADKFAAALFRIGSRYLVFDPAQAAYPAAWRSIRVDEGAMLEDLLCGGLYGDASMSRKHSSNMTLAAVAAQKQGKKRSHSTLSALFPAADRLERRYPYLKKHPYLVPAAWADRLWQYARETGKSREETAADALKIGKERLELLRQYGIVK